MITKEVIIVNKLGLHARPAAKVVRLAAQYTADVHITYDGKRINAKSIMGLMMLAVEQGAKVIIEAEGEDEAKLMRELLELITNGFGES